MADRNQVKIATIIGARPQFIKAAAVSRCIAEHNGNNILPVIEEILVHTGQHYDDGMSAIFFKELEIPEPRYNLNIGSGSHGWQTGQMLIAIEDVLIKEKPDWVLIYGDTNSTLAGALAAAKVHIPIAHVEAGLRSFNRLMPEEINRVVADHLSRLLLCPSEVAVDNLLAEGVTNGVHVTGDVMADALRFAAKKASVKSGIIARLGVKPRGYPSESTDTSPETFSTCSIVNEENLVSTLERDRHMLNPCRPGSVCHPRSSTATFSSPAG